jgi:ankyrin repeat protein
MDSQANDQLVWRKIWRRYWFDDFLSTGGRIKTWRRVLKRVPANYSPPAYPLPSTDAQSITYADCEAFFEAVTEGSRKKLIDILNTHGPEVTTELSKSYNEQGQTPLLVAIQQGNLDMVKFLVGKLDVPLGEVGRFLWRDVEYLEVPALYAAILRGEMDIAAYLLSMEVRSDQTTKIIDSITSSPNDRQEKINILELMGAINFYFQESHPAPQNGLMYWREALNLRNSTMDGRPAIPKTILASDLARVTLGFTSEFTTFEQLEQLSSLQLFTQAVLVSQRVLNTVSPGPNIFALTFLCQCASVYSVREGLRGEAINILTIFLQQTQELQWKEYKKRKIINWALGIMAIIIIDMRKKRSINPGQEGFTFVNLMATFNFATNFMTVLHENHTQVESDILDNLGICIVEMIFSLTEMMPRLNSQERQQFESRLSLFIRKDHRWGTANENLLHTICSFSSQISMSQAENDQRYDSFNNANILFFDFPRDYLDIDVENDFESVIGSDPLALDNSSTDSTDIDSNDDVNDDLGSDIEEYRDDYSRSRSEVDENQDSRRFPSWENRYASSNCSDDTDVSECPSWGHNGEMSADESDDEDFELIRNHRVEMEIQTDSDNLPTSAEDLLLSSTQLILRLGADPNAADSRGYTPLHILAVCHGSVSHSQMLLEYGAHMDQPDKKGMTPLLHFQKRQRQLASQGNPDLNLQFLINYALPLPLSCLSARVVSKNQMPFNKEKVSPTLQSFIQRH